MEFWEHKVNKYIENELSRSLKLKRGSNTQYPQLTIFQVLIYAAFKHLSFGKASEQLHILGFKVPHGDTTLYHLSNQTIEMLEEGFDTLFESLYRRARRQRIFFIPMPVAIDFNDIPWYGEDLPFIVRGKQKQGTNRFLRFASIGVVKDGCRFQLKVLPVMPGTSKEDLVKRLLDAAHQLVSISTVLLDREFYIENVIKYLMPRYRFLMPVKQYPKVKVHMQKCIDEGRTSIEYEMTGGARYALFTHYAKEIKRYVAFATNMDVEAYCTASLPNLYRKRFGIDTQYRVKNNFRFKTCSRVYGVRYVGFMTSIVLYNLWVWINVISSLVKRVVPGEPTITVADLVFAYTRTLYRTE